MIITRSENHEAVCPHCLEPQIVNEGTGIYECPDCDGNIELSLVCPKCKVELEVEEWGRTSCPDCIASFDSWKKAQVTPSDDSDEEDLTVSCEKCGFELEDFREVGQAIKDQIPRKALTQFGPVVLNTLMFNPLAGMLVADWEAIMDIPHAVRAYVGDEVDAINAAKFPCPKCKKYVEWETT